MTDVPDFAIVPEARGTCALGRTRIFPQVKEFVTLFELAVVTVKVMVVPATLRVALTTLPLARSLMLRLLLPPPEVRVIVTVGAVPVVSKTKPDGTVRMMVPVSISPIPPSATTGPLNVVHAPPAVLDKMAVPPVAGVSVNAAFAVLGRSASKSSPKRTMPSLICLNTNVFMS